MGRLSAFCWWATILMFLIHMGFCFEKKEVSYDILYPDTLLKIPILILSFIFLYWAAQSAVYFMFGRAVLKQNIKQMIILAVIAVFLPIIRFILLHGNPINGLWDMICWIMVLLWIGWNKWFHRSDNSFLPELIFYAVGIICVFIRSYYGYAEIKTFVDFLGIYSFVVQDMLRSFAMIFLAIWLLMIPKEKAA